MVQPKPKEGLERVVDMPQESSPAKKVGSLAAALKPYGIKVSRAGEEYGISPAVILRSRERSDGTRVFLCYEETKDGTRRFYTLTAGEVTNDWKEVIRRYKSEE